MGGKQRERRILIRWLPSESHGDGAGGDLGEAGREDERGGRAGAGEPRGEGEGHSEAVGHPHDNVAHHLPRREVTLPVAQPLLQHRVPPRGAVAVHRSPDAGRDEARGGRRRGRAGLCSLYACPSSGGKLRGTAAF